MRFKGTKLSNRTVALFAAAILLLSSGGFLGVKAAPQIRGQDSFATVNLNTIDVQLVDKAGKEVGESGLLTDVETVKTGMTYQTGISVKNNGSAPAYVRLVVRKYWLDAAGKKDRQLDPKLIQLGLDDTVWKENKKEATAETSVFYYTKQLAADADIPINSVRVEGSVLTDKKNIIVSKDPESSKTIYTYIYKYDGYSFNIEAEVQAVQTHNANDAIKSIWGVDNVTASGTSLSVK